MVRYSTCIPILAFLCIALAQRSPSGINANNGQLLPVDNKYRSKDPVKLAEIVFSRDASNFASNTHCNFDIDILWQSKLGTPIYSVPLIVDLFSDGNKDIIVTTNEHYVEVLDKDGHKAKGWPFAFPGSTFLSNPLIYDYNIDGVNEVVVTTQNAEIAFISEEGVPLYERTLKVPPLKVRKDWFDGLDLPNVAATFSLHGLNQKPKDSTDNVDNPYSQQQPTRKLLDIDSSSSTQEPKEVFKHLEGWLTDEAIESFELFLPSSTPTSYISHIRQQKDPLFSSQYLEDMKNITEDKKYIYIDAHVLHTPVIADLENDGKDELIVAVSYYFDSATYSDIDRVKVLDVDVDISKYIGSGIVVFDLTTSRIKFTTNLDVTTDSSVYASYIFAPPTVVDLDGDKFMEIIVGTGFGYIYLIDHKGNLKGGNFPITMDTLYAQVVVEDINGDGELELIACDVNSNVVCFNAAGEELWEARVSGHPNQAPTLGDVDGDGTLDVVLGTSEGHVYALKGTTGEKLEHFPIKLGGKIQSQPLLVKMSPLLKSLQIVIMAQDGFLYILDGATGCYQKIDIGEASFSMVLADDITGNNKLDLLVTTRNGNLYLISTESPYHPLRSWISQSQGGNGFTYRYDYQGIFVTESSRTTHDVYGDSFSIQFEIISNRMNHKMSPSYYVEISYGNHQLFNNTYSSTGTYIETIAAPHTRTPATIEVKMINEHGQIFLDYFTISFNLHFYRVLKWVLVLPFSIMFIVIVFIKELQTPLPQ